MSQHINHSHEKNQKLEQFTQTTYTDIIQRLLWEKYSLLNDNITHIRNIIQRYLPVYIQLLYSIEYGRMERNIAAGMTMNHSIPSRNNEKYVIGLLKVAALGEKWIKYYLQKYHKDIKPIDLARVIVKDRPEVLDGFSIIEKTAMILYLADKRTSEFPTHNDPIAIDKLLDTFWNNVFTHLPLYKESEIDRLLEKYWDAYEKNY